MKKAQINGAELEYEVVGAGEPVLLIGTGPIADSFLPFFSQKQLTDRYCLITYRQRHADGTGTGLVPVTYVQHASDAAGLLDHLGVRRAHVAGHSTGAVIAVQIAFDRPEQVATLALLEPTLVGAPGATDFLPSIPAVLEAVGPALTAYGAGDRERAMATFLSVVSGIDQEACMDLIEEQVPGGVAKAMQDADQWFSSYLPALTMWQFGPIQAARIHQPVLSVLGTNTQRLYGEGHDLLHSWFPQTEDCFIEGAGHLLHLQGVEPVARGAAEFFARHPLTPTAGGAKSKAVGSEV